MEKPIVINAKECKECNVPKGWGHEIIFENNELYCGKLLVFKKGCNFSMHYHLIKDETWYVQEGEFLYRWIDTETGKVTEQHLKEGDSVRQHPGQPHQLKALTDGVVFEVSTEHFDSDSYRVYREWYEKEKENLRGKVFFTKGGATVDLRTWDQTLDIVSMGEKYGWEGAMAYGNLIHNELNEHGPGIQPGDVYLDLGANIGMSAMRAELCGASKIYCIEPDPGVYEALEMNKADNWEVFNMAVADYDGKIDIPKWPDWWDNVERDCVTLEKFFEDNNIEHVDYMKVDIEGHEIKTLPSISPEIYSKINKIFIEYHENTELTDEERTQKRSDFVLEMLNKGYNNYHVALGYHQSFIYLWK